MFNKKKSIELDWNTIRNCGFKDVQKQNKLQLPSILNLFDTKYMLLFTYLVCVIRLSTCRKIYVEFLSKQWSVLCVDWTIIWFSTFTLFSLESKSVYAIGKTYEQRHTCTSLYCLKCCRLFWFSLSFSLSYCKIFWINWMEKQMKCVYSELTLCFFSFLFFFVFIHWIHQNKIPFGKYFYRKRCTFLFKTFVLFEMCVQQYFDNTTTYFFFFQLQQCHITTLIHKTIPVITFAMH